MRAEKISIFDGNGHEMRRNLNFYVKCNFAAFSNKADIKDLGEYGLTGTEETNDLYLNSIRNFKFISKYLMPDDQTERLEIASNIFYESLDSMTINIAMPNISIKLKENTIAKDILKDSFDIVIKENKILTSSYPIYEYEIKELHIKDNSELHLKFKSISEYIFKTLKVSLFPFFYFESSISLEKVSSSLVSSSLIYLLEEANGSYVKPYSDKFNIELYSKDSNNTKFIVANDTEYIQWKQRLTLETSDKSNEKGNPLYATIGFTSEEGGAYIENIELYIISKDSSTRYSFGIIRVKCEVIDEDERYRSFFYNFGIPDPATYPTLFKEVDPFEEGTDWNVVNKKSKELFLTYDKIFPYIGTYKALLNALSFLGYDDIIIKEWYKVQDSNDKIKKISFQSIDLKNKKTLKTTLASYGIDYEDFLKLKKLNQISILYKINDIDQYQDSLTLLDGTKVVLDIPTTKRTYEYENDAILMKLLYLKKWLEEYVIGINCKIIDLTGEGIYFYRVKHAAYSTSYQTIDYSKSESITPVFVENSKGNVLKDSSTYLTCSLSEFSSLKIKDRKDFSFKNYTKAIFSPLENKVISTSKENIEDFSSDDYKFALGTSFKSPVTYDELSFQASVSSLHSTFHEYGDLTGNSELLVEDDKIRIIGNYENSFKFSSDKCPLIFIDNGSIRYNEGNWNENKMMTVTKAYNQESDVYGYAISMNSDLFAKNSVILKPRLNASLEYTDINPYSVSLFLISNYDIYIDDALYYSLDDTYILDISDGYFSFKKTSLHDCNISSSLIISREGALDSQEEASNIDLWFGPSRKLYADHVFYSPRERIWSISKNGFNRINVPSFQNISELIPERYKKNALKFFKSHSVASSMISENTMKSIIDEFIEKSYKDASISLNTMSTIENIINATKNYQEKESLYNFIGKNKESSLYIESKEYSSIFIKNKEYESFYKNASEMIRNAVTVNNTFDLKVSRTGTYSLQCKGFQENNEIYANQSKNYTSVSADSLSLKVYSEEKEIKNDKDFYSVETIKGNSDSNISIDPSPVFQKEERISDFTFDYENFKGTFKNISYSYGIPRKNEMFILNDFTEKIEDVKLNLNTLSFKYLNENPKKQSFLINDWIKIYSYNTKKMTIEHSYGPYKIESIQDNNFIVSIDSLHQPDPECIITQSLLDSDNSNKNIMFYISNISEHDISFIENDDNYSYLYCRSNENDGMYFKKGNSIKILAGYTNLNLSASNKKIPSEIFINNNFISQVSVRVLDIYKNVAIYENAEMMFDVIKTEKISNFSYSLDDFLIDDDTEKYPSGNDRLYVDCEFLPYDNSDKDSLSDIVNPMMLEDYCKFIYNKNSQKWIPIRGNNKSEIKYDYLDQYYVKAENQAEKNSIIDDLHEKYKDEEEWKDKTRLPEEGEDPDLQGNKVKVSEKSINYSYNSKFEMIPTTKISKLKNSDDTVVMQYYKKFLKVSRSFHDYAEIEMNFSNSSTTDPRTLSDSTAFEFTSSGTYMQNYIDNTWSGYLVECSPFNSIKDWNPSKPSYLYSYVDVPISLEKDSQIILDLNQNYSTFREIERQWKIYADFIEDSKLLVYNMTNENPSINLSSKGNHEIKGFSYDMYGNCYETKKQGMIQVRDSSDEDFRSFII